MLGDAHNPEASNINLTGFINSLPKGILELLCSADREFVALLPSTEPALDPVLQLSVERLREIQNSPPEIFLKYTHNASGRSLLGSVVTSNHEPSAKACVRWRRVS